MRPYSVEFYEPDFTFRANINIDDTDYSFKMDYLDPEQNTVEVINAPAVALNDYIRIFGNGIEHWGIVTKIDDGNKAEKDVTKITYKDLAELLDIDMVIDTDILGEGALEGYISDRISEIFINGDTSQKVEGLLTDIGSTTTGWTLDIVADDGNKTVVNLFNDIILPAFQKYEVRVLFRVDIGKKTVTADISKNSNAKICIETDLPNVLSKTIKYKTIKKEINKTSIYNKKDFDRTVTYYLHPSGEYDNEDADRIVPVVFKLETVSTGTAEEWKEKYERTLDSAVRTVKTCQSQISGGEELDAETIQKEVEAVSELNTVPSVSITLDDKGVATGFDNDTVQAAVDAYILTEEYETRTAQMAADEFDYAAEDKAAKTFANNKYENNIELVCLNDDSLINPVDMDVGQVVDIMDGSKVYETILTGKQISDVTTLIFGNVRVELTKILKGRS